MEKWMKMFEDFMKELDIKQEFKKWVLIGGNLHPRELRKILDPKLWDMYADSELYRLWRVGDNERFMYAMTALKFDANQINPKDVIVIDLRRQKNDDKD